jgi:hypothetical protein
MLVEAMDAIGNGPIPDLKRKNILGSGKALIEDINTYPKLNDKILDELSIFYSTFGLQILKLQLLNLHDFDDEQVVKYAKDNGYIVENELPMNRTQIAMRIARKKGLTDKDIII